ncbi:hypothetical protein TNCV_1567961 [Trichonephila clavipes]|nr:hypothetical protein TNCV_1567961 [Trichonephila clavipes]
MCVGDLPMIVGIEIGRMQNFWIGKMTGEIIIEVNTGIDTRGTRLTKGSRTESVITKVIKGSSTETVITEVIMGSRIAVVEISSEIGVRVRILTEGDRRQGGRLNCLKVPVDQKKQSQIEVNPPIMLSALCVSPVELQYVCVCVCVYLFS